jgi:hydroxyacylglutathione hydrolase
VSDLRIETITLGPFATNCYVAWPDGSRTCWIIDASFQPDELIDTVRAASLEPAALVLTHAHVDHIAGVQTVRQAWPTIPVMIHEAERHWLADADLNLSGLYGLPVTAGPPDRLLRDGQTLELDGLAFQVLHTPGHSPGGIALYQPQIKVLFAGDTLFFDSIGRSDFPNADGPTLLNSIHTRLLTLPDDVRIYPGHGPDTTIGRERRENPFLA